MLTFVLSQSILWKSQEKEFCLLEALELVKSVKTLKELAVSKVWRGKKGDSLKRTLIHTYRARIHGCGQAGSEPWQMTRGWTSGRANAPCPRRYPPRRCQTFRRFPSSLRAPRARSYRRGPCTPKRPAAAMGHSIKKQWMDVKNRHCVDLQRGKLFQLLITCNKCVWEQPQTWHHRKKCFT